MQLHFPLNQHWATLIDLRFRRHHRSFPNYTNGNAAAAQSIDLTGNSAIFLNCYLWDSLHEILSLEKHGNAVTSQMK